MLLWCCHLIDVQVYTYIPFRSIEVCACLFTGQSDGAYVSITPHVVNPDPALLGNCVLLCYLCILFAK